MPIPSNTGRKPLIPKVYKKINRIQIVRTRREAETDNQSKYFRPTFNKDLSKPGGN